MANDSTVIYPWRIVSFFFGTAAAAISAYGAYEYALSLEGKVSYLVFGAPLVAIAVAKIPPSASSLWSTGNAFISGAMWFVLPFCAAYLFYSAATRVHMATAGAEAERYARVLAASRAADAYKEAKAKLTPDVERAEATAKANPSCSKSTACRTSLALAVQIREEVERTEANLARSQAVATVEPAYKAPPWLLPVCLDLLAFVCIWAAFTGPWIVRESSEKQGQIIQVFSRWLKSNWGKTETVSKT